jgi:hypothetical protein
MLRRWFKEDRNWARSGLREEEEVVMEEATANESKNVDSYARMVLGFLDLVGDSKRQSLELA